MGNKNVVIVAMRRLRMVEVDGLGACIEVNFVIAKRKTCANDFLCLPYTIRYTRSASRGEV